MSRQYFYQELTCFSDTDISPGFILGKVMQQLHLQLVSISQDGQCPVGVSFPGYAFKMKHSNGISRGRVDDEELPDIEALSASRLPIGNRVRLIALDAAPLERLNIEASLSRYSDYVQCTSILPVNRPIRSFSVFRRRQPKQAEGAKARLIRRRMRRKGESEAEATEHFAGYRGRESRVPYVDMESRSSGERFRLYIERSESEATSDWTFNTYGLSSTVAVPEF